ncbi:feruloyl esterase-like protein [Amylocystis lapponica]|nr:feruloyl esterase-like protein [Amylocystis lapponica]
MIYFHFSPWARWTLVLLSFLITRPLVLASPTSCSSFALQNLTDVQLAGTIYYPANTSVNLTTGFQSIDVDNLPAFCRVQLVITTNATSGSFCDTEVWLPDEWNNRVLAFGNGGFSGGVAVGDLGHVAMNQGFAGVSTNTGHNSSQGDGSWAGPGNDDAIVDWTWRALHLSVVAGKEVVQQYYNQPYNKSYYLGCSTGQSLKEVQTFPDDFDGVVVGSPASWQTHLQDWSIHMNLNVQPNTSTQFIKASVWSDIIHPAVLSQCDAFDGLSDGIVSDPEMCKFRPEQLVCRPGQNVSTCLTVPQIEALKRIYSDYYETDQTWILGRYYPGGEIAYPTGLVGSHPFSIGQDWFRYFVLNDTEWTIDQYNSSVVGIADNINPGQANAIDPNITAFAGPGHNGKLLHYVGWADQLISPGLSIYYYDTVDVFTRSNTDWDIDNFYRLFTVPGMNHCGLSSLFSENGYGANAFGAAQQAQAGMPPLSLDAEHNVLAAMVKWVEEGVAPSSLTAAYWNDNKFTNGVGFTRPICKYPSSVHYVGGDESLAASFKCV